MNNKPFQYLAYCGTEFECAKCDFSTPISYEQHASSPNSMEFLLRDVAEMIGYHAVNIRPELNGFAGYDCLEFEQK